MSFTTRRLFLNGGAPQAGNPAGQEPPANTPPVSSAGSGQEPPKAPTLEQIQTELAEARREAAKYRTERNSFETELKKRTDAELTESERLKKTAEESTQKVSQLEQRLRRNELSLAIEREGRKLNLIDGEMAVLLIESKVQFDDEGKPKNVAELLTQLLKDKPFLVGGQAPTPGAGASATNPARGQGANGGAAQTFSRKQLEDPKFYEANRTAILHAMRNGLITE